MANLRTQAIFVAQLILLLHTTTAYPQKSQQRRIPDKLFVFHTDEFWLNLHHFLYVLARAKNKERDATREAVVAAPDDQERGLKNLSEREQTIWHEAVAAYAAGPAKKDLIFDDPLPAVTNALAVAGDAKSLSGVKLDPAFGGTLESAAPIYRKVWWQQHHDANRKRKDSIESLVDRYGNTVLAFITHAYQLAWPNTGFPVHISAYSDWAGAYSTTGNLLVVSSLDPGGQGAYGLETVFHEAMHQWDDQIREVLRAEAVKRNKSIPRGLSHALIFFTAGEAVRQIIPGHVPAAEKFGLWQRVMGQFKTPLEETWKPYLDGHGTRNEALAELVKRVAVEPPKQ